MGLLAFAPTSVFAQDEAGEEMTEEAETEAAEEAESAEAEAGEEAEAEAPADGAADATAAPTTAAVERFPIRRGLFAEADMGVDFAIGGRNTNRLVNGVPASAGTSNIEPYLGMMFGYDFFSNEKVNVAAGLKLALILNGGSGVVSSAEAAAGAVGQGAVSTIPSDFSIWQAGAGVNVDILFTDRLGLGIKLDGGMAVYEPDPRAPAESLSGDPLPDAGGPSIGGIFGLGAGVTYATLLPGFQVGLDVRFVAALINGLRPGNAITVPLKYNF